MERLIHLWLLVNGTVFVGLLMWSVKLARRERIQRP